VATAVIAGSEPVTSATNSETEKLFLGSTLIEVGVVVSASFWVIQSALERG
jgi:hypothetical protein